MRAEELKTIVVIGAGIMGQQIAMNTAIKGRRSFCATASPLPWRKPRPGLTST